MEQFELLKRVIADNVTVEHKEQSLVVIPPQYALRQFQRSGSAKSNFLLGVRNLDIVLLLEWFKRVLDMKGLVIDSDDYLNNTYLGECLSDGSGTSI